MALQLLEDNIHLLDISFLLYHQLVQDALSLVYNKILYHKDLLEKKDFFNNRIFQVNKVYKLWSQIDFHHLNKFPLDMILVL